MMDYKLIEALAMVVVEGGFDAAARRLHITQSAVSQRIKLLEERTGQVLLARTQPPRATGAGRRMVKHFHQVKRLEEDLLAFMPSAIPGTHGVLAVGINGDSLATWFLKAIGEFLKREKVVLDLRSDDQEQTHRLLKEGEVMGCVSARDRPVQGCRMDYLGRMTYRMLASPSFVSRWFPDGAGPVAAGRAPIVVFNRVDELHHHFFRELYRQPLDRFNAHYLPSSEQFVGFIAAGHAYGMLPDLQSDPLTASGRLVEIVPGRTVSVDLYWHCWNLRSGLIERFSAHLIAAANRLLEN